MFVYDIWALYIGIHIFFVHVVTGIVATRVIGVWRLLDLRVVVILSTNTVWIWFLMRCRYSCLFGDYVCWRIYLERLCCYLLCFLMCDTLRQIHFSSCSV